MYLYHPLIQTDIAAYFTALTKPKGGFAQFGQNANSYLRHAQGTALPKNRDFLRGIAALQSADAELIQAGELMETGTIEMPHGLPASSKKATVAFVGTTTELDYHKPLPMLHEKEVEFTGHLARGLRYLRQAKDAFRACDDDIAEMNLGSLQMRLSKEIGTLEKNLKVIHPDLPQHLEDRLLELPQADPEHTHTRGPDSRSHRRSPGR